jgi:hypothetical protein
MVNTRRKIGSVDMPAGTAFNFRLVFGYDQLQRGQVIYLAAFYGIGFLPAKAFLATGTNLHFMKLFFVWGIHHF